MRARDTASMAPASKAMPDIIRPYGDTTGDGMVQVSFTLPMAHDKLAEGAALQLAAKMGLAPALLLALCLARWLGLRVAGWLC